MSYNPQQNKIHKSNHEVLNRMSLKLSLNANHGVWPREDITVMGKIISTKETILWARVKALYDTV